MSSLLRFAPLLLATAATGCTVAEYDRPDRPASSPSAFVARAAVEMVGDVQPGQFVAHIGEPPLGGHGEEESHGEEAEHGTDASHVGGLHGAARLAETAGGHLVYLDADGFAVRISVMLPSTAFADRMPDGDADAPPVSAPVVGGAGVEEAGDATAQATAEMAAELAEEDAGLTVLQTYAGESRLRATMVVNGVRMDSWSGELHLRTVRGDRLRGWFYFDAEPLSAKGTEDEAERVYGAFDARLTPGLAAR